MTRFLFRTDIYNYRRLLSLIFEISESIQNITNKHDALTNVKDNQKKKAVTKTLNEF